MKSWLLVLGSVFSVFLTFLLLVILGVTSKASIPMEFFHNFLSKGWIAYLFSLIPLLSLFYWAKNKKNDKSKVFKNLLSGLMGFIILFIMGTFTLSMNKIIFETNGEIVNDLFDEVYKSLPRTFDSSLATTNRLNASINYSDLYIQNKTQAIVRYSVLEDIKVRQSIRYTSEWVSRYQLQEHHIPLEYLERTSNGHLFLLYSVSTETYNDKITSSRRDQEFVYMSYNINQRYIHIYRYSLKYY